MNLYEDNPYFNSMSRKKEGIPLFVFEYEFQKMQKSDF